MFVTGKKYSVFSIKDLTDKNGQKTGGTVWVRAGSAWCNKDGSLNLFLDVLPMEGKLHVRETMEKRDVIAGQPSRPAPVSLETQPVEGHS
jgi:hypothetical protein